jgi:hypothetical protein
MAERSAGNCVKCEDLAVIYTPIGRLCPKHWTDYCQEAREARTP